MAFGALEIILVVCGLILISVFVLCKKYEKYFGWTMDTNISNNSSSSDEGGEVEENVETNATFSNVDVAAIARIASRQIPAPITNNTVITSVNFWPTPTPTSAPMQPDYPPNYEEVLDSNSNLTESFNLAVTYEDEGECPPPSYWNYAERTGYR